MHTHISLPLIRTIALVTLALLLSLNGCTSIGPSSIERDRFEYSTAISESWKEMMLLNIVKLRYGDTPMFLEVGSVVNQYTLERELEAIAGVRSGDLLGDGLELGGSGKYSNRPTITYSPLIGEKFSRSLLRPIPPHALLFLIQSGWSADFLLRLCLSAINDLYNSNERLDAAPEANDKFEELLTVLTDIQRAGGLGSRLIERNSEKVIIFFRQNVSDALASKAARVAELLGLDPEADEYPLVYGSSASHDREIAMLTRSMFDIISEMSQYVQVPPIHIRENRASPGIADRLPIFDSARLFIKSSKEKPGDAFLAVNYRGYWFYIEDVDYRAKRGFSFLIFLMSLTEGGSQGLSPVLTLPTG